MRDALSSALLAVDRVEFFRLLEDSKSNGMNASDMIDLLILPILEKIGVDWDRGVVSLSQVFMAGRIVEQAAKKILSTDKNGSNENIKIAIALLDDYHILGKQMVLTALRIAGFQISDYGRVTVEGLVDRIQRDGVALVLVSTLMLRSAWQVKELRNSIAQAGLSVKIFVGGAPFRFDQNLWREVGADAFGNNAAEAIQLVRDFIAVAKAV